MGQWSWDSGLGILVLGQWSWDTSLGTVVLGQWSWDSGLGTVVVTVVTTNKESFLKGFERELGTLFLSRCIFPFNNFFTKDFILRIDLCI